MTLRHRRLLRRRALYSRPALIFVTFMVLCSVAFAITATNGSPEPSAEAAGVVPGTRADITQWFRGRDKALVEVNNALVVVVQKKLDRPGPGSPGCRRLDAAIKALAARGRAPDAAIDALARAGEDKLGLAATACLAGDLATTQRLVAEAMAERAAASLPLEEALEGE
jgi:hypothetical protein